MDGVERMGALTQGIGGVGAGYLKGLLLKSQIDALRKEQQLQELLTEAQVKQMGIHAEALKAEGERQTQLFPFALRGLQAETAMTEAKSPIAQAISQGGPVTPEQEMMLYGKTARPQPDQWQKWLLDEPSIDPKTKAMILGRINLDPDKAEDIAMKALRENLPKEEYTNYAKEFLKNQSKLYESLLKMNFGQGLRTQENIRKEGVKATEDIHNDFRLARRQLNLKGLSSDADPEEISNQRLGLYEDYITSLRDRGEKVPPGITKDWIGEVVGRWQAERKAIESRYSIVPFMGLSAKEVETQRKALDQNYAARLVEILGQEEAEKLLRQFGGGK